MFDQISWITDRLHNRNSDHCDLILLSILCPAEIKRSSNLSWGQPLFLQTVTSVCHHQGTRCYSAVELEMTTELQAEISRHVLTVLVASYGWCIYVRSSQFYGF